MPSPRPTRSASRDTDIETGVQAIRRIVRWLRLANQRVVGEAGVSAAQLFVLTLLAEGETYSLQELADRTLTDRTSVRDVLRPLLARRLVERHADPRDARRSLIRLSARGRALLARAPEPPTSLLVRGFQAMPGEDMRQLGALLNQFVDRMGLADDPISMLFDDAGARQATATSRTTPRTTTTKPKRST